MLSPATFQAIRHISHKLPKKISENSQNYTLKDVELIYLIYTHQNPRFYSFASENNSKFIISLLERIQDSNKNTKIHIKILKSLKYVFTGVDSSGKSQLIQRLIYNKFNHDYNPTLEDCYIISNNLYQIEILDTCRDEDFPALYKHYIMAADVIIYCFDLHNVDNSQHQQNFTSFIQQNTDKLNNSPILIVGCKYDLLQKDFQNFEDLKTKIFQLLQIIAKVNNLLIFGWLTTSAKQPYNIDVLKQNFFQIANQLKSKEFQLSKQLFKVKISNRATSLFQNRIHKCKDGLIIEFDYFSVQIDDSNTQIQILTDGDYNFQSKYQIFISEISTLHKNKNLFIFKPDFLLDEFQGVLYDLLRLKK